MGIFDFLKKEAPKPQKRSYYGATTNNLFASWLTSGTSADALIKQDLKALRNRARDLERNNAHVRRYLELLRSNVVGHGFTFQSKAKDISGSLDTRANDMIENEWKRFRKLGNCDVSGKLGMKELLGVIVTTLARDGEVLVRIVEGFPNAHGFALQVIECDHLDEQFNDVHRNIKMGIEYDKWGRPRAYHISRSHPGDYESQDTSRERIDANQIIHLFKKERPSQTRGVTWLHGVMNSLQMYNGFAEAALVEKRLTAAKMGFYVRPKGEEYYGDSVDDLGNPVDEATPGMFGILPENWDFKTFDPKSGNDNFADFGKVILRNIASGLSISYNSLASDLEGVNFSSIRAGLIEERDFYKSLQLFIIDHLLTPVFERWLSQQLLRQNIALPLSKFEKFNAPMFIGKTWSWVDPYKDAKANEAALQNNFKTLTQILNEQGLDLEETLAQRAREKELLDKYKLTSDENDIEKTIRTLKDAKSAVRTDSFSKAIEQQIASIFINDSSLGTITKEIQNTDRPTPKEIYQYHIENGVVTKNQVRESIGLTKIDGLDEFIEPNQGEVQP